MATITLIGNVTKYSSGGQFLYLFPACNLSINNDVLDFRFYNLHRQQVAYSQLENVYGTTTPEELGDYFANNGFFSIPTGSGGGGTQDVDIVADSVGLNKEVTQLQVLTELQTIGTTDAGILTTILHESNNISQSIDHKLNVIIALLKELNI